jgi:hypothetical protein
MDLHERGVAVPSMTTIGGRPAMRAAIVNHRTGEAHIDGFGAGPDDARARANSPSAVPATGLHVTEAVSRATFAPADAGRWVANHAETPYHRTPEA